MAHALHRVISRVRDRLPACDATAAPCGEPSFTSIVATGEDAGCRRFSIPRGRGLHLFFRAYERELATGEMLALTETVPKAGSSMLVFDFDRKADGREPRCLYNGLYMEFILERAREIQARLSVECVLAEPSGGGGSLPCVPDVVILTKEPYVATTHLGPSEVGTGGVVKHGFHLQFPRIFLSLADKRRFLVSFPSFDNVAASPWLLYGSRKAATARSYTAASVLLADGVASVSVVEYFSQRYAVTDTHARLRIHRGDVRRLLPRLLSIQDLGPEFSRGHFDCELMHRSARRLPSANAFAMTAEERLFRAARAAGITIPRSIIAPEAAVHDYAICDATDSDAEETVCAPALRGAPGTVQTAVHAVHAVHAVINGLFPNLRIESTGSGGSSEGFIHTTRTRPGPCPLLGSHVHSRRPPFFKVFNGNLFAGCACGRKTPGGKKMVCIGTARPSPPAVASTEAITRTVEAPAPQVPTPSFSRESAATPQHRRAPKRSRQQRDALALLKVKGL